MAQEITARLSATILEGMRDTFPSAPFPPKARAAAAKALAADGVEGSLVKEDGRRAFRLFLALELNALIPGSIKTAGLLRSLEDATIANIELGRGPVHASGRKTDFLYTIVGILQQKADDEFCPAFIEAILAGAKNWIPPSMLQLRRSNSNIFSHWVLICTLRYVAQYKFYLSNALTPRSESKGLKTPERTKSSRRQAEEGHVSCSPRCPLSNQCSSERPPCSSRCVYPQNATPCLSSNFLPRRYQQKQSATTSTAIQFTERIGASIAQPKSTVDANTNARATPVTPKKSPTPSGNSVRSPVVLTP
ncbi:hypothetical protein C8R47DRAFT_1131905 [Mycena vitilis]|nr:hypothetical protein C8R47DRAFT_1131905 [Mycena vitilis]